MMKIMVRHPDLLQRLAPARSMPDHAPLSLIKSDARSAPPHDSLPAALESAAAQGGPFLVFYTGKEPVNFDFRKALDGAQRWASLLQSRGVKRGDRVPILMPTSPSFVEALLGAQLTGAIPVPLPFPLTFGGVERYVGNLVPIIEDSGARCFATDERIRDIVAKNDQLRPMFDQVLTEHDLPAGPCHAPTLIRSIDPNDTGLIQYTSGTTGRPKGVCVSHRALVSNAYAIAHGLRTTPSDVGVCWLPMFHDMGLIGAIVTAVCHPYPIHLMSPAAFIMRPYRWLQLLSDVKGTLSPAPNFAYELCVSRPWPDKVKGVRLDNWRVALNGSEPVMPVTTSRFVERFEPMGFRPKSMTPVYGMAESTLAVTFSDLDAEVEVFTPDGHPGTFLACVGKPVAGASVRITDDASNVVPEQVIGQIETSGPSLMDGYFRNDTATSKALSGGWLRTGDLGVIRNGRLFIIGRSTDMIIKAGRNLYPVDIERVVLEALGNPSVAVAAFARPNPTTGTDNLVVAAETLESDPARREEIIKTLRGEVLSVIGVGIDEVHLLPSGALPRTTSGKIRRKECARVVSERSTT
jgi:fatty-acyl-CoA synthase